MTATESAIARWALVGACLAAAWWVRADDWPTYRHDAARSGVTEEKLRLPLSAAWTYHPLHAPRPAWGDPNPRRVGGWYGMIEGRRVHFDDAYHAVVAGGLLFFGSSSDHKVYCLDAATGKERWAFFTGGPVRLAPTIWRGNVYFGSDDGHVYCLKADDGSLVWTYRAAPSPRRVLGSGRMISLWPVRTGVLVEGGVAYFGAGIFPAEGVYLYAVSAEDGKLLWCNDRGGAEPQSRISPQGYLLAAPKKLYVPMGRVFPACYDRATGDFVSHPSFGHEIGGTCAVLAGDVLISGTEQLLACNAETPGTPAAWFGARQLVATTGTAYAADDKGMTAFDRSGHARPSLRWRDAETQRKRLAGPLNAARRKARGFEDIARKLAADLKSIDERLAANDASATPALRAQKQEAVDANAKALESARRQLADLERQGKDIDERLEKARKEMDAATRWRCELGDPESLILAGGTLFAGGKDKVTAVDAETGKPVWSAPVRGLAKGLAVAEGRLFVSTDSGTIHAFAPEGAAAPGEIRQSITEPTLPNEDRKRLVAAVAEQVVEATGVKRGYALVLDTVDGRLAYELAKRTELHIVAACPTADGTALARKALDAAGLYGARVTVAHVTPPALPFADYFANLVVSEGALQGKLSYDARDAFRVLRPAGGKLTIALPATAEKTLLTWSGDSPLKSAQRTTEDGIWMDFTRGPLPGAGSWSHPYAEPGNTACGDDQLVRCPLGVLWFGEPGPEAMEERHVRATAPIAAGGRFFVRGVNVVMAYDSYNGLKLWERTIPGGARLRISNDASNMVVHGDALFLVIDDKCLRLDAATGETRATYELPPVETKDERRRMWGYLACVGETLFGSRSAAPRASEALFAIDLANGQPRWVHMGRAIPHSSISIGDGQLFFVDEVENQSQVPASRLVVSLDAATGKPKWKRPVDLTGCLGGSYYSALGSIYARGALVLFGVYTDGHYWKEFFAGQFGSRRVVVLDARNGDASWSEKIAYRVRPLVIGETLHAEPWAFDLRTGERKMRRNPITGREEPWQWGRPGHHCGGPAATPHTLFFRSYTLGFYDLDDDDGTFHFGGQRPGCWINFIPADGLLLMPEASSGCLCPFPNMCTVVMQHRETDRAWGYFSLEGSPTPVERLAVNLGAPGDRRDQAGALWLGYPRRGGSLVLTLPLRVDLYPDGEYLVNDPARAGVQAADAPWLFHSGALGLRRIAVPLAEPGDGAARYTVRLSFAGLEGDAPGARVFDIKIQGKAVEEGFDPIKAAGGPQKAVRREYRGIEVKDGMTIELVAGAPKPSRQQMPLLQAVEIVREEVLSAGLLVPSFQLNDAEPQQAGEARVANHKAATFTGTLVVESPPGFRVSPDRTPVQLKPGETATVALKATVAKAGPPGTFPLTVNLLNADGKQECQARGEITYLGPRKRIVVSVSEDAHVSRGSPTSNMGSAGKLWVDGGDAAMGDASHQIAYLRFRLDIKGKIVSLRLRLHNTGNPSGDSGHVRLVEEPWEEKKVTYEARPKLGRVVAKLGKVTENQVVDVPLDLPLEKLTELSLAIDPSSTDGIDYGSREGKQPAELMVEYEP